MLRFSCISFDELTLRELYDLLALRQEVFIVEQNCPYLDADGKDLNAWHLLGRDENDRLVCYTRLLPQNEVYEDYCSIGRVLSSRAVRGSGAGRALMEKSIDLCRSLFQGAPIKIGAQSYLLKFYESFGFESTGEEYIEDGIPHTKMVLN
jgi:ElaA protein